jgi:hypothetical protein
MKTCMEVSNYMYSNGSSMPSRPLLKASSFDDFGTSDQDYMVEKNIICKLVAESQHLFSFLIIPKCFIKFIIFPAFPINFFLS